MTCFPSLSKTGKITAKWSFFSALMLTLGWIGANGAIQNFARKLANGSCFRFWGSCYTLADAPHPSFFMPPSGSGDGW